MENANQLRPIGRLMTDAWQTYRVNCKKISLLMLWGLIGFVPWGLMIALGAGFSRQLAAFRVPLSLITFIFYLGLLYWTISTFLGLIILIKNPEKRIIEVFNAGRKLVWGDLAVGLVLFLFVSLWSILFIIPGVIYYVFYALAVFVFVYDGYRRSAALARSKELVGGNWWPVFFRLAIALILYIAFGALYGYALTFINGAWRAVIAVIYYIAVIFALAPLYLGYLALIYNDLVAIKPTSSLPKEKKDHWLVAVAAVFLIITILIILALVAVSLILSMRGTAGL